MVWLDHVAEPDAGNRHGLGRATSALILITPLWLLYVLEVSGFWEAHNVKLSTQFSIREIHADVIKHLLLFNLYCKSSRERTRPIAYIEPIAGAWSYDLPKCECAYENVEHETGVSRLWQANRYPSLLQDFLLVWVLLTRINNALLSRALPPLLSVGFSCARWRNLLDFANEEP